MQRVTSKDIVLNVALHCSQVAGQPFWAWREEVLQQIEEYSFDVYGVSSLELSRKEFLNITVSVMADFIAGLNQELGTEYSIRNYIRKFDENSIL